MSSDLADIDIEARTHLANRIDGAIDDGVAKIERQSTAKQSAAARSGRQATVNKATDHIESALARRNASSRILDSMEAERIRLATPFGQRRLIGFVRLCDEKTLCDVLGVTVDDMHVVWESGGWVEKQVGGTRWYTVGRKGANEAFVRYDATGQHEGEAIAAVKKTLEEIEQSEGKRGIVLIGNPKDPEYQRLKEAIENDDDLYVAGEVDVRGKSRDEIYDETDKLIRAAHEASKDTVVAMEVGPLGGKKKKTREGHDRVRSERQDGVRIDRPDDSDVDVDVERIDGGWKQRRKERSKATEERRSGFE